MTIRDEAAPAMSAAELAAAMTPSQARVVDYIKEQAEGKGHAVTVELSQHGNFMFVHVREGGTSSGWREGMTRARDRFHVGKDGYVVRPEMFLGGGRKFSTQMKAIQNGARKLAALKGIR